MKRYTIYMKKDGGVVKDCIADFGMWCASVPFKMAQEAKSLSSRDWKDEDGTDEYVPQVLRMKDYEMDVKFCCKGERDSANATLRRFLDYLTGRDGSGVMMSMYCDYTKIGRKDVRFVKIDDEAGLVRDEDGDILIVTITFKVNDPVTDVVLSK